MKIQVRTPKGSVDPYRWLDVEGDLRVLSEPIAYFEPTVGLRRCLERQRHRRIVDVPCPGCGGVFVLLIPEGAQFPDDNYIREIPRWFGRCGRHPGYATW